MEPFPDGQRLLLLLVENARRILEGYFGLDRAEATFFDIINLLKERSDLKGPFLEMVEATLRARDPSGLAPGSVPRELTELAAHELRWPELRTLAEERLTRFFYGDTGLAASDPARSIVDAFADDWEDREFYRAYSCA